MFCKPSYFLLGLLVAPIIGSMLAGCATTVNVAGDFPARVQAAADVRRVAVAGFEGPGGNAFAAGLETKLAAARFKGQPYFSLVGADRRIGADAASARTYGRSIGADGVYFGSVSIDVKRTEERSVQARCVRYESLTCKEWGQVNVTCVSKTITMIATPRLVSTSSGEIIYTTEKRRQTKATWCPGDTTKSDAETIAGIQREILADIHMDVAPHQEVMKADIVDDTGGLSEALTALFQRSVQQMKAGDPGSACEGWAKIRESSSKHAPTIYNLAVCAETSGRYADALKLYDDAQAATSHDAGASEDRGISSWLNSVTKASQNMLSGLDEKVARARVRVKRLMAAQGTLTAIEEQRQAEAEARRLEAEALERQRQEEAQRRHQQQLVARKEAAKKAEEEERRRQKVAAEERRQEDARAAAHKRDLVARFGEEFAGAILAKRVVTGMTKDAVTASLGAPVTTIRASAEEEMWRYQSEQVVFKNGKVTYFGK